MKNLHTRKTSNASNFGWLIQQMSINQKRGRETFSRRFVSGSVFVSPYPSECYLQSETKIEPDLRLSRRPTGYNKRTNGLLGFQITQYGWDDTNWGGYQAIFSSKRLKENINTRSIGVPNSRKVFGQLVIVIIGKTINTMRAPPAIT